MKEPAKNPESVVWSHSNRLSDFFEVPADAREIREVTEWLLQFYERANLRIMRECSDAPELYFVCYPANPKVVAHLKEVERDLFGRAV